ncbi:hypothetical protein AGDE_13471 [Angomonas deanei]|uniref:Uncharacterized protein n=1 Tax=Angomonas deanei TaxID=59799 RepID=A0A7G2CP04_9TRYP|nr:hypothetical protein AGDE_13471 [Angomonas deanei]CAD2219912.1 Protein of unknown function (DUF523), putative [Angomonas deanei]|eukprot:EPY22317.1 hypothetical protein AGDE_13471 [Angomonas deanei]
MRNFFFQRAYMRSRATPFLFISHPLRSCFSRVRFFSHTSVTCRPANPLTDPVVLDRLLWDYRHHPQEEEGGGVGPTSERVPTLLCSACLLDCNVAYHGRGGAHGRRKTAFGFVKSVLSQRLRCIRLIPLCPEVQLLQLPVPRDPIRLETIQQHNHNDIGVFVSNKDHRCLLTYDSGGSDLQDCFNGPIPSHPNIPPTSEEVSLEALLSSVDGVVLKSRSPSCGLGDARVYDGSGPPPIKRGHNEKDYCPYIANQNGFFAQLLKNEFARRNETGMSITSEKRLCFDYPTLHEGFPTNNNNNEVYTPIRLFLNSVVKHFEQRDKK